jgi:hypothetical protein
MTRRYFLHYPRRHHRLCLQFHCHQRPLEDLPHLLHLLRHLFQMLLKFPHLNRQEYTEQQTRHHLRHQRNKLSIQILQTIVLFLRILEREHLQQFLLPLNHHHRRRVLYLQYFQQPKHRHYYLGLGLQMGCFHFLPPQCFFHPHHRQNHRFLLLQMEKTRHRLFHRRQKLMLKRGQAHIEAKNFRQPYLQLRRFQQ